MSENVCFLPRKELQLDVANHAETHAGLDNTAEGISKVCVEEVSSVEDDIHSIDKRWDELSSKLQSKHADIEALQGQLKEYQQAVKCSDERISEVEAKVDAGKMPVSDVEEMKKQVQELETLKDQLEQLKPEVQLALETGQGVQDNNPRV